VGRRHHYRYSSTVFPLRKGSKSESICPLADDPMRSILTSLFFFLLARGHDSRRARSRTPRGPQSTAYWVDGCRPMNVLWLDRMRAPCFFQRHYSRRRRKCPHQNPASCQPFCKCLQAGSKSPSLTSTLTRYRIRPFVLSHQRLVRHQLRVSPAQKFFFGRWAAFPCCGSNQSTLIGSNPSKQGHLGCQCL
jgi:hypothetical protein